MKIKINSVVEMMNGDTEVTTFINFGNKSISIQQKATLTPFDLTNDSILELVLLKHARLTKDYLREGNDE